MGDQLLLHPSRRKGIQQERPGEEESWTTLDISNMQIRTLSPNVAIYTHITELCLQNNCLTTLPVSIFTSLLWLQSLDLSCNNIQWIPAEISNLLRLKTLLLFRNQIRELPWTMGKLFRLEQLSLEGNPISRPSPDILRMGAARTIMYLRDNMPAGDPPPPRDWTINKKIMNGNIYKSLEPTRVLCYNVLAETYALPSRCVYCPDWALLWSYRKLRILAELTDYKADVMCLQEVEMGQYKNFFLPKLAALGYSGMFRPKSRARTMDNCEGVDGCATFYRNSKFELVKEYGLEYQSVALQKHEALRTKTSEAGFNRLISKDNIATAVLLRPRAKAYGQGITHKDRLLVVNTHVHWNPEYSDVKLMQCNLLIERIAAIQQENGGGELPMLICGDFNSVPGSGVYTLLSERKVDSTHPDFKGLAYGRYTRHGLHHQLHLKSSYCEVGGEPAFTNYTGDFKGVLDYIWYSTRCLDVKSVLAPIDEQSVLELSGALPNPYNCSDHIPLVADVLFRLSPKKRSMNQPNSR